MHKFNPRLDPVIFCHGKEYFYIDGKCSKSPQIPQLSDNGYIQVKTNSIPQFTTKNFAAFAWLRFHGYTIDNAIFFSLDNGSGGPDYIVVHFQFGSINLSD